MGYDEVYEEIRPYLSDPEGIREFLNGHNKRTLDELIEDINKLMAHTDTPLKTDYRILLNALLRHS